MDFATLLSFREKPLTEEMKRDMLKACFDQENGAIHALGRSMVDEQLLSKYPMEKAVQICCAWAGRQIIQQGGRCANTGIPFSFTPDVDDKWRNPTAYKRDPSKGFTASNTVIVLMKATSQEGFEFLMAKYKESGASVGG